MKITKTKSGKYSTLVAIPGVDGKRRYKRFTARTKSEVRTLADDYINEHKVAVESMSFSAAAERFISRSETILSPNTIRGYKVPQGATERQRRVLCPSDRPHH